MKSTTIDMSGSVFCEDPLERHLFTQSTDHEYCSSCGKTRALHLQDGFIPNRSPSRLPTDPNCRYRGGHPYFRVHPIRNEAPLFTDPEAVARANRIRHHEHQFWERLLSRFSTGPEVTGGVT